MIAGLVFLFALAQHENLLANPSFEDVAPDGRPAHWSAFVMPQSGAFAEADPLAVDGAHAAMLHVPNLYETEPANNWSQIVVADIAGHDLLLTGEIRTEAVGEAAFWLQCFSRNPARVVAAGTSTATQPLSGSNDWTAVEVRLSVPEGTDFAVVRCVIKGRGSAWFDSLHLEVAADAETPPDLPAFEPSEQPTATAELPKDLDGKDIIELNKMLNDSIAELEATNARILERVQKIQAELGAARAATSAEDVPLETVQPRHPLVPHVPNTAGAPK